MKRAKTINRLQGYFDQGLDQVQNLAENLEDRLTDDLLPVAKRRARAGLKRGRKQLLSAEELFTDAMREHQTVTLLAGIGLLAMILAIVFAGTRPRRDW